MVWRSLLTYGVELQGHAIKNKDLLVASGALTLKGADMIDDLQEDELAVGLMRTEHYSFKVSSALLSLTRLIAIER